MKRRTLLRASATLGLLTACNHVFALQGSSSFKYLGEPMAFDYAWLKGLARRNAGIPYENQSHVLPDAIKKMNWDQFQSIRYRDDQALWGNDHLHFQVKFFHLGMYFDKPVRMFEVNAGKARELAYEPALFDYGKSGLRGADMPENLGFAGFRINYHTDLTRDIAAFLGASYFRAVGGEMQYGLSARGLAIDCGLPKPEEFPQFSAYWLQRPASADDNLVVFALLDSPSVTGAYRFEIISGNTLTMDVDAALYPRKAMEHIGIAPLTSMFRCGDNDCRNRDDWRPAIHDSDGLAIWRGNGERIWRPLIDPEHVNFNSYQDASPRGFGLMQRDRNFDHYQDDGVFYNRRPSLWVEPKSDWGKGAVQLVELPTADETSDNIAAFWHPADAVAPGQELLYSYRMYWGETSPGVPNLGRVVATRTGRGGILGQRRTHFSWRFVIDFAGGALPRLGEKSQPAANITASRCKLELISVRPLTSINGYRAMFDIVPDGDNAPINIRTYLEMDGQALTETWMYQWIPPSDRSY
jgi:glucans biosynthesis protein